MANWYIGQQIVAVVDHSHGRFKRGDEFVIKGLKAGFCGCVKVLIDIGLRDYSSPYNQCLRCGEIDPVVGGVLWYSETNFAPLEPIQEAIKELMEQPKVVEL